MPYYLYSLSINRKVFKQKVAIDNLSDDELYGSTRFPRSAVHDLCIMLHDESTTLNDILVDHMR